MQNASASNVTKAPFSSSAIIADSTAQLEKFLEGRKLDPETASRLGITASDGRIEIPYRREGEIKNRKYRSLAAKKFWQDGGKQFVWNYDVLLDGSLEQPILITEGEFDALAAIQSGYPRTVSVPNGGTTENVNLDWLADIENLLDTDVILAFDNDEVGHNLLEQASTFLGRARCKWLKYPDGCKDLNDVLVQHGEKGVMDCIASAAWVSVRGFYRMEELAPIPYRRAMSAGMGSLDNHMKLRLGDFSVCTGIPGHGKTTFLNDYINRIINNYDLKVCFASFEQPPQSDHLRALRTWYAGKLVKNMVPEEIKAADKWINEKFMFIVPGDDDTVSMEWLLDRMNAVVIRHGIKIIVIDPWNEMDHQRPPGVTLTEYTGRAIRHLKAFAKKFGVHVMVVAHPAKMLRDRNGKYPIPTLYDISDSSHWANKADLGFVVHRDPDDGDTIRIVKSRHHTEIGKVGVVDVKFSQDTGRYTVVDNQVLNGDYR
jgi:twinkle protein